MMSCRVLTESYVLRYGSAKSLQRDHRHTTARLRRRRRKKTSLRSPRNMPRERREASRKSLHNKNVFDCATALDFFTETNGAKCFLQRMNDPDWRLNHTTAIPGATARSSDDRA